MLRHTHLHVQKAHKNNRKPDNKQMVCKVKKRKSPDSTETKTKQNKQNKKPSRNTIEIEFVVLVWGLPLSVHCFPTDTPWRMLVFHLQTVTNGR